MAEGKRGRPPGVKNKRTVAGAGYAEGILVQTADDLVHEDPNPVRQRLKVQARNGVGSGEDQLPAGVFTHLADRAWGKVLDRAKVTIGAKPYEGEDTDALAKRAEAIAALLRADKETE